MCVFAGTSSRSMCQDYCSVSVGTLTLITTIPTMDFSPGRYPRNPCAHLPVILNMFLKSGNFIVLISVCGCRYVTAWREYSQGVSYLNCLYSYLNLQHVKRQKVCIMLLRSLDSL